MQPSTESTPPASQLARDRIAAGLTQYQAAAALAARLGGSAASWKTTIARYESWTRAPMPERLAVLLELYGVDATTRARRAVMACLPMEELCDAHGVGPVCRALEQIAAAHRSVLRRRR